MAGRVAGKVAVVVGAGQTPGETVGNGRATALLLAREGARVLAVDRDLDSARETAAQIAAAGGEAAAVRADVTVEDDLAAAIAAARQRWGRVDVLHNNVGISLAGGDAPVEDIEAAAFDRITAVNLRGMVLACKHVLPVMREQGGGHVLAVSTIFSATLCPPALGHYIGSKAALETALQALAVEVAPFGIRVTIVQPGPVNTELSRDWARPADDPRPDLIDTLYEWVGSQPGLTLEDPADVAEAIVSVVADDDPPLAAQTCPDGTAWVATALRDPSRRSEQDRLPRLTG